MARKQDPKTSRNMAAIKGPRLYQVSTDEIDAATKLLDKACQKLRGIPDVPPQRISDLENTTRQLRQLTCILDSCRISANCEVSQAQKALLLMPRTAKGASTSSEELNAQMSPLTDDEFHVFAIKTNSKNTSCIRKEDQFQSTDELLTKYDDWKSTSERILSVP